MKNIFLGLIIAGFLFSILWSILNGRWEAALVTQTDQGKHHYLMRLAENPIWNVPEAPTRNDFVLHFSNGWKEIPGEERIEVYHKWSWWYTNLMIRWLVGALVIGPVVMIFYRKEFWLGAIGRVAVALIGAATICILLWALTGGWGPYAPELFGTLGLVAGLAWAIIFWSRHRQTCEPDGRVNECSAAAPHS